MVYYNQELGNEGETLNMANPRVEDEMYQILMRFLWECRDFFAESYDATSQSAIEMCIASLNKARSLGE